MIKKKKEEVDVRKRVREERSHLENEERKGGGWEGERHGGREIAPVYLLNLYGWIWPVCHRDCAL